MTTPELKPCPFCGAGTTEVRENGRPWLGMRYGEPVSVSVRHWCEPIDGQPSRMIERVGRDRAAAVAAWNTRAADANIAALQAEVEALRAEVECVTCELMDAITCADKLAEALECMIIGACAVAVPHNGERAVLQDAVNIARAALAAYRKGGRR